MRDLIILETWHRKLGGKLLDSLLKIVKFLLKLRIVHLVLKVF